MRTPVVINDGAWHHIAFAREGSTVRLYIDGVLLDSGTFPVGSLDIRPGGMVLGQDQDCVGGCFDPNQAFDGLIDELEIFNRALEAWEIQAIFDAGSADKCKPVPPPTVEELLQRIEDLENHTHTYLTGRGWGHNNTEAETGPPEPPMEVESCVCHDWGGWGRGRWGRKRPQTVCASDRYFDPHFRHGDALGRCLE